MTLAKVIFGGKEEKNQYMKMEVMVAIILALNMSEW